MKILFVLEHYYPNTGGVEILFKRICEGLVKKGHEITVVTSTLPNALKVKEIINGVKIHRINVPQKWRWRRYLFTFMSIPHLLKIAKDFDIIHTTTYNGAPPAWFVSKIKKKPSLITIHEILGEDWKNLMGMGAVGANIHKFLEWLIAVLGFDKYICVSESTKRNLSKIKQVSKEKISVIYNAVDYSDFDPTKHKNARAEKRKELGIKDNEFIYAFYGRPGVSKGAEYLANAIPKITSNIPNSKGLFILGTDPKERYDAVTNLINKNSNNNAIIQKPVKYSELPKYLLAADCIVIPSITEGFGYCVTETCALGIPVVTTNTTAIPEVVSGKHVLIPAKDSDAIAKGVLQVYNKKYVTTPLKKFETIDCVDGYIKTYEELLNKK
jgi:glycosyltransferase involved in cell wall biosynthesis